MSRAFLKIFIGVVCFVLLAGGVFLIYRTERVFERTKLFEKKSKTVLFAGDVMFDRGVEYFMQKNGIFYPLKKVSQFLKGADIVFANLEGPIVKDPPYFSDESLKFAFSQDAIKTLSFGNFNLLSLANNHTFNLDEAGFKETKELLAEANIDFIGQPFYCVENDSFKKNGLTFLAFNKTFPFNCSNEEIAAIIEKERDADPESFLTVIFHWGEEYEPESSAFQQELAHQAIDAGADLIVGSHPHVVQEIAEYRGKLIFYSLGNFIFDQYFSEETQQGLAAGLELYQTKAVFRLFPIQSRLSRPFLMDEAAAEIFLQELADKSSESLNEMIRRGMIEMPI